jgi:hypothetical protein
MSIPSLPLELYDHTFSLVDPPTLASLALASSSFNSIAVRLLYRQVMLRTLRQVRLFVLEEGAWLDEAEAELIGRRIKNLRRIKKLVINFRGGGRFAQALVIPLSLVQSGPYHIQVLEISNFTTSIPSSSELLLSSSLLSGRSSARPINSSYIPFNLSLPLDLSHSFPNSASLPPTPFTLLSSKPSPQRYTCFLPMRLPR